MHLRLFLCIAWLASASALAFQPHSASARNRPRLRYDCCRISARSALLFSGNALARLVAESVRRLRDRSGLGVLLIEHDMRVITAVCDRVVVLDHGEKIAEGSPAQVRRAPAVIKAYLGDEPQHA